MQYSVLMSVYKNDNAFFLSQSLDSLVNQTKKPDEIIVIVDGPISEELDSVLLKYKLNNNNLFKVHKLEKNMGLGFALNQGIKLCKNEIIARMDADDISHPNRCYLQLMEFEKNPNLVLVGTWVNEFDKDSDKPFSSRRVPLNHKDITFFSKRRSPFNHPTVMFKKSKILSIGGYRSELRKEDFEFFVRIIINKFETINIPLPLLLYRSNIDNLKRRKSYLNCKNYILLVYRFWKIKHSSFLDFIIVCISQSLFFILPLWLIRIIDRYFLRYSPIKY